LDDWIWRFELRFIHVSFGFLQITDGDIDERAISELSEFSSNDGLEILRQFESAAELKNVRNKSAYLHGEFMMVHHPVRAFIMIALNIKNSLTNIQLFISL
jgi:hypothetical protein